MSHFTSRRDFLKVTCGVCGAVLSGVAIESLEGCRSASGSPSGYTVVNGKLTIPRSAVAAEGSVISAQGLPRDIFVRRTAAGSYEAVLLRCTHMNGKLNRTPEGFTCVLHGSRFAPDGSVLKGPAKQPLLRYPVTEEGENLIISVA
ncbi:MAG: Rieske (2Fe-2S) protein [Flavobacteriales bacterium]|nr:Rieske (2Fe-2S) protein [Flavobacteriales bacterium]MDW8410278.1 Rieske (2Fe-2S) protein [Flavobacteriales bacterium]